MRSILIHGRWVAIKEIKRLRKEQQEARKASQLDLFPDAAKDVRPSSQKTASGRLSEPLLFDKN